MSERPSKPAAPNVKTLSEAVFGRPTWDTRLKGVVSNLTAVVVQVAVAAGLVIAIVIGLIKLAAW